MKYYKQLIQHDPENGQCGDCFRTVIACLLDLRPESVPHVCNHGGNDGEKATAEINEYLARMGLYFIEFGFSGAMSLDQILEYGSATFKDQRYTLLGASTTGVNHIVACLGDKIEHNPNDSQIIGPAKCEDDTVAWFIGLIGKAV